MNCRLFLHSKSPSKPFAKYGKKAPLTTEEKLRDLIAYSSPVYDYVTPEQLRDIARQTQPTQVIKGRQLIIDTRDRQRCQEIQRQLQQSGARANTASASDARDLCSQSSASPFVSLTVYEEMRQEDYRLEIDHSPLTSTEKTLFNETRNLTFAAVGLAGILWLMPESITNWDKSGAESLGEKYRNNVRGGPVHDKDDWAINYIGHPIAGAAYYQVARNLNLSPLQSFGYSVLMSTFFWEYGVEAFAEKPSIQDLWVTPIIGSLIGELFYQMEQKIKNNGGTVMGSKKLGKFVMVLLNPAGSFSNQVNRLLGKKVIQDSRMYLTPLPGCRTDTPHGPDRCDQSGVALRFEFRF